MCKSVFSSLGTIAERKVEEGLSLGKLRSCWQLAQGGTLILIQGCVLKRVWFPSVRTVTRPCRALPPEEEGNLVRRRRRQEIAYV